MILQALSVATAGLITVNITTATYCSVVLPLGDTGVITHSSAIFAIFFSRFIEKAPVTLWKSLWTVVLFVGLMLVVKPASVFAGESEGEFEDQNL